MEMMFGTVVLHVYLSVYIFIEIFVILYDYWCNLCIIGCLGCFGL